MSLWSLTKEESEKLLNKKQERVHELEVMRKKTPEDLYLQDLDELAAEMDKVEAKELEEERKAMTGKPTTSLTNRRKKEVCYDFLTCIKLWNELTYAT